MSDAVSKAATVLSGHRESIFCGFLRAAASGGFRVLIRSAARALASLCPSNVLRSAARTLASLCSACEEVSGRRLFALSASISRSTVWLRSPEMAMCAVRHCCCARRRRIGTSDSLYGTCPCSLSLTMKSVSVSNSVLNCAIVRSALDNAVCGA